MQVATFSSIQVRRSENSSLLSASSSSYQRLQSTLMRARSDDFYLDQLIHRKVMRVPLQWLLLQQQNSSLRIFRTTYRLLLAAPSERERVRIASANFISIEHLFVRLLLVRLLPLPVGQGAGAVSKIDAIVIVDERAGEWHQTTKSGAGSTSVRARPTIWARIRFDGERSHSTRSEISDSRCKSK